MTLSESSGRDNNLNLIRMVAAMAVLVSHAFPVTLGRNALQPLEASTGYTLGFWGVTAFFFLSGYLIVGSYDRSKSQARFWAARILRIMPGLAAALVLSAFIIGPLVTTLAVADYWRAPETWSYVSRNLSLAFLQYPLPGVFEDNPFGNAVNGPLWTLFFEFVCYAGAALAGALGLYSRPKVVAAGVLAFGATFVALDFVEIPGAVERLVRLGFPFALGAAVWVYRDRIRLSASGLALAWAFVLLPGPQSLALAIVALGYSLLYTGFVPAGRIRGYNRLGDYSYGTYIYAFPVQQLAVNLLPGQSPWMNMALSIPCVLLLALASWHFVERPSLHLVKSRRVRVATHDSPSVAGAARN